MWSPYSPEQRYFNRRLSLVPESKGQAFQFEIVLIKRYSIKGINILHTTNTLKLTTPKSLKTL